MNYLLIVRHGEYGMNTAELTPEGENQIKSLADKIKNIIELTPKKIIIVSSRALRASQSANIITKKFGLTVEEVVFSSALFPDGENLSYERVKELNVLRTNYQENPLLVMVGHIDLANDYPAHVLQKLGVTYSQGKIEKGQGVLINLNTYAYQIVP